MKHEMLIHKWHQSSSKWFMHSNAKGERKKNSKKKKMTVVRKNIYLILISGSFGSEAHFDLILCDSTVFNV